MNEKQVLEREKRQKEIYAQNTERVNAKIQRAYDYLFRQIEDDIAGFYSRYAAAEGISLAEAKKRVKAMDVKAFEAKAKRYVETKDFSDQANKELKLYNATMKINRLELLKAELGLEIIAATDEIDKTMEDGLNQRAIDEYRRQAGILGASITQSGMRRVQAVVDTEFYGIEFHGRLWTYSEEFRNQLSSILLRAAVTGRHPHAFISDVKKALDITRKEAAALLVTEMTRVQTEAQKKSYQEWDYDEYVYIDVEDEKVCPTCHSMHGKRFPVKDMKPGDNAPPMHTRCRCSTAAWYPGNDPIEVKI